MATELRRMQIRHDTAANWATANPTLLVGEEGLETDTGKRKVGDGATAWTALPYEGVGGVRISGTPTAGQVPIASSGTAATWGTPSGGGGAVSSVVGQTGAVTGSQILADSTVTAALAAKLATAGTAADSTKVGGVTISGTPTAGQVPTATNGTTAAWSTPAAGAGDATTGAKGVVQLAGDLAGTAAAPVVAKINGVAVTGTPTSGQVPTATNGTAATWATPASAAPADGSITAAKLDAGVPASLAGNAAFTGTYTPLTSSLTDVAAVASTNGALVVGKHNPVDASASARAMTLADAAGAGRVIVVEKTDATANTVTISGNIRGSAGTVVLTWQREAVELLSKADGSWWPIAGHKTKSSLDAVYSRSAPASVVVKASNSRANTVADFTCTGTDDQTTINAALAALPTNGGQVLLLAGTYSLSGSVVINRKSVVLAGEGMGFWDDFVSGIPVQNSPEGLGMTKLKATAGTFPLIKVDNTTQGGTTNRINGLEIKHMYLYGASKSLTTSIGIECNDVGRPTDMPSINNIMIHNTYDGIILATDAGIIFRCSLQDLGNRGIYLPLSAGGGYNGNYPEIHSNVIADIGGYGIECTSLNPLIHDNTIVRTNGVIITASGGIVSGNSIWYGGGVLWYGTGGYSAGGAITGNDINATTRSGQAIYLQDVYGAVVTDNRVGSGLQGIRGHHVDACIIADNVVRSTATASDIVSLSGACTGNMIHDNRIFQDLAVTNTNSGFYIPGTITDFAAHDNLVSGLTLVNKIVIPTTGTNVFTHDNRVQFHAVTDTFTRADSASSLGLANTGHAWGLIAGTWGISSNAAYCVSGTAAHFWAVIDEGRADVTVSVTAAGTSRANQGLCARMIDTNNGYMLNFSDTSQVKLYRIVAGAFTMIGSSAAVIAQNDVVALTLVGSSFTVTQNGTSIITVTDTQWQTGNRGHGLWAYGPATAAARSYDNFSLVAA